MRKTLSASELRTEINRLRVAAGLEPTKRLYGTSLQTLRIILTQAQRGEFN